MRIETQLNSEHRRVLETTWRRWHRRRLVERVWDGDPSVWSRLDVPELADRLGWLTLHETMRPRLPAIMGLAEDVAEGGAEDVILLGMGGSSLAPEVFAAIFGPTEGWPRLSVVDSTHPDAIAAVVDRIDLDRSVFVVSSKSGTTLETLSLFRYFYAASGGDGNQFVAVTDPGSGLAQLADEREFRATVTAPPDVGGRYSALTPFGLVPAALVGVPVEGMLDEAAALAMRARRHPAEAALDLGAVWGTATVAGRDKLTVVTSESMAAFPAWLEQLVAESLGKDGTGIIPVAGEPSRGAGAYGDDRQFMVYALGSDDPVDAEWLMALADAGAPVTHVGLDRPEEIGAEMFRAELATAAAGEILGVHPFDQPDVEAAKNLARDAMTSGAVSGGIQPIQPAGIGRWLEGVTHPGSYVAIQAYLPADAVVDGLMDRLRVEIGQRTEAATTCGYGPRFLHSTGQLHKGGPDNGVFLQLVDRPNASLGVPESDVTFEQIIAAQADGDHAALVAKDRHVARVDLGSDRLAGLTELVEALR